jgi:hypothetical protein
MGWTQKITWGVLGAAVTMLTRKVANTALHDPNGSPVLARVTQRNSSLAEMLTLAMFTGVVLALGDVLREHRQQAAAYPSRA